jgi:hypothetical protein
VWQFLPEHNLLLAELIFLNPQSLGMHSRPVATQLTSERTV